MTLGEDIQKLREYWGFSRTELAIMLICDYSTVYKWEKGIINPSKIKLAKMCEIFELDKDYFNDYL